MYSGKADDAPALMALEDGGARGGSGGRRADVACATLVLLSFGGGPGTEGILCCCPKPNLDLWTVACKIDALGVECATEYACDFSAADDTGFDLDAVEHPGARN